jgi:hypothetical protein
LSDPIGGNEKIIPFFKKHNIIGEKSKDFADWCKVAELIKAKDHLTSSGLDEIRQPDKIRFEYSNIFLISLYLIALLLYRALPFGCGSQII